MLAIYPSGRSFSRSCQLRRYRIIRAMDSPEPIAGRADRPGGGARYMSPTKHRVSSGRCARKQPVISFHVCKDLARRYHHLERHITNDYEYLQWRRNPDKDGSATRQRFPNEPLSSYSCRHWETPWKGYADFFGMADEGADMATPEQPSPTPPATQRMSPAAMPSFSHSQWLWLWLWPAVSIATRIHGMPSLWPNVLTNLPFRAAVGAQEEEQPAGPSTARPFRKSKPPARLLEEGQEPAAKTPKTTSTKDKTPKAGKTPSTPAGSVPRHGNDIAAQRRLQKGKKQKTPPPREEEEEEMQPGHGDEDEDEDEDEVSSKYGPM